MGKLIYGQGRREVEIEDRTLAHLKAVILIKLRRGESFAMSWPHGLDSGSGRSTIWMNPTIPGYRPKCVALDGVSLSSWSVLPILFGSRVLPQRLRGC